MYNVIKFLNLELYMKFKACLFCVCAALIGSSLLAAEEDMDIALVDQEIPMDLDLEDEDDLLLEDLALMEDDMFDEMSFDDEDELDTMTATDIFNQDDQLEPPKNIS